MWPLPSPQVQAAKAELEGDVKRKDELLSLSLADVKQLEKQRSQHDEMITKLKGGSSFLFDSTEVISRSEV